MPFKEVDPMEEQREFEELLKDPEAKKAYEEFELEYTLRQNNKKQTEQLKQDDR